jgi:hypothetical protein
MVINKKTQNIYFMLSARDLKNGQQKSRSTAKLGRMHDRLLITCSLRLCEKMVPAVSWHIYGIAYEPKDRKYIRFTGAVKRSEISFYDWSMAIWNSLNN